MKNLKYFYLLNILFVALVYSNIHAKELKLIENESFNVNQGDQLKIKADAGDIVVKTWDKNELSVKIYGNSTAKSKMEFSFEQNSEGVEIIGDNFGGKLFSWFSSIDVKYEIRAPQNFDLDLKTSGGDLVAKNISGNFELKTSGGDIYIKNADGELNASTSGGDISILNFVGSSNVSTSGGDIEIDSENGIAKASTSGGDITIKASEGEIIGKTSGGDIILKYIGENHGISLITSGGDIDADVPSDLKADVEFKTSGGEIDSKFANNRMTKISKSKLVGKYNNGGDLFVCKSSGGDITVREK